MALHPVIQRHIKIWYRQKMDLVSAEPIHLARKKLLPLLPVPSNLHLEYKDKIIDGNFVIRLFYPKKQRTYPSPLVIFIRASGFAIGSSEHYNVPCAHLAEKFGCVVAGIEHRLSPEFKFPIPLDDCQTAVMWLHKHAQSLGLDPDRMILWGECSGANLSASLCHRLALQDINLFTKHIMLYPVLANHQMTPSKTQYATGYMTDLNMLDFTLKQYLNSDNERYLKEVSPILNTHFEGLPPTQISVGEYDPFKDEALLYTQKFQASNPNIQCQVHPGLVHGFIQYYDYIPQVQTIIDNYIDETLATWVCPTKINA